MSGKFKIWLIAIVVAVVLMGLFLWPKLTNPSREDIHKWVSLGIECLSNGHVNLAQHIHPILEVYLDGQKQIISANIGVVKDCMAEVHTHDDTGKIHIETADAEKQFNLKQFFDLWGQLLVRDDYDLEVLADDLSVADPASLILRDNQKITVKYLKKIASDNVLEAPIDKNQ
jgi:hypothetical protein